MEEMESDENERMSDEFEVTLPLNPPKLNAGKIVPSQGHSSDKLASFSEEVIMRQRQRHQPQKKKHPSRYTTSRIMLQHITTATHVCILLYVILVVYLCFSEEFTFFTWHPLLLSIGWMFLMTEAILSISPDNILSGTLPKPTRVIWHWVLQSIALVLIASGFFVVYINKDNLGKSHFTTWHGLLGLIGVVCTIPTCLNGVIALYQLRLREYISPKVSRFLHIFCGIVTFSCGSLALFLSVYTKWFERRTSGSELSFGFGLLMVVIAVGWTLARPVYNFTYSQLKCIKT